MRRIVPLLTLLLAIASCTPGDRAALAMANTVAMGVACGMAASNGTPCTPQEVLAEVAQAQKDILQAIAAQASQKADPAIVAALVKGLEANAAAQRELAEQVIKLAEQKPAPVVPTTASSSAPAAPAPSPVPSSSAAPPATDPAPAPSASSSG